MESVASFINTYAPVPVLITAGYALFIYRQLGKELRIFSHFLFLSGIIEITAKILWFQSKNNMPLLHFYVAAGFCCLCWFYSVALDNLISKKIIWATAALFLVFSFINSLFFQDIFAFNSNALTTECILVVILSLSTFIVLLNDIVRETREHLIKSLNWINSGLFLYYSSTLVIFYFGDLFTRSFPVHLNQYTWVLHSLFMTVMYTFFMIGLWNRPRK
jgi:hypothetical protein